MLAGLIQDETELKVLILFAMRKLELAAPIGIIAELTMGVPGTDITYFDVVSCLNSLVDTEHVSLNIDLYEITEKGIRNGEITEDDIPYSVRLHAERAALETKARVLRSELIKTSRTIMRRGGYEVELSLSDGGDEIMRLKIIAANEAQAEEMEQAFKDRAEKIFSTLMEELLG